MTGKKPTYGAVVTALKELNNAVWCAFLGGLPPEVTRQDGPIRKAHLASINAEYMLRRVPRKRPLPRRPGKPLASIIYG
jgi:hypothetical protein